MAHMGMALTAMAMCQAGQRVAGAYIVLAPYSHGLYRYGPVYFMAYIAMAIESYGHVPSRPTRCWRLYSYGPM